MLFGKYINRFYIKYALFFIIGVIALVAVDIAQLYIPEYLGRIVDFFDNGTISGHESEITNIIIGVLIVAAIMLVGRVAWRFSIFYASGGIQASLRDEMFLKAERLSVSYYHDVKVGSIMSWFTSDLDTIEEFFGWGTVMMVDAFFLSILVIVKMFMLDWALAFVALIPSLLIVVWGFFVEKIMSDRWNLRQKEYDRLYDFTQENFTGIRVIKAFVKENQQIAHFSKIARKNADTNVNFSRISVLFDVFISIVIALILALILGVGGWLVYSTATGSPVVLFGKTIELSAGKLVTFAGYFDTLVWPLMALGQVFTMRSRSKASLKRVSHFLDTNEDIKNPLDAIKLNDVKGKIEFNNFTFTYPNTKEPALKDINLIIEPGETIGIVGKIGSGKTTLVNSLFHLYNVKENSIKIDGTDLMKIDIKNLRDNIAYVPQDNFLFSDSIKNNVNFSNDTLDMDKVIEATKFASVHDNIINFEEGYETISGERGVTLSGGQKQRISIARAYIKDSPILVLDDSVSAVDLKTEEEILHNIREKRKDKTTLVIASRISTVSKLDKIIVLNDGKVEAFDTHENLLKISPTYSKMNYLQELEKEVTK